MVKDLLRKFLGCPSKQRVETLEFMIGLVYNEDRKQHQIKSGGRLDKLLHRTAYTAYKVGVDQDDEYLKEISYGRENNNTFNLTSTGY